MNIPKNKRKIILRRNKQKAGKPRQAPGLRAFLRALRREAGAMMRQCTGVCLLFVLVYLLINSVVTPTGFNLLMRALLYFNGQTYLGPDNLRTVLLSPAALLLAVPALLLVIVPPIFEVSALIHAFSLGKVGRKPTLSGMISAGLHAVDRSLHPRNWLIVLFFAVLLPLTGVMSFTSGSIGIAIPEFISDFLLANVVYGWIYVAVYVGMLLVTLSATFMLNFYIVEERSVLSAYRESARLIRGRRIRTILWLVLSVTGCYLFLVGVSAVLTEIPMLLTDLLGKLDGSITRADRVKNVSEMLRYVFTGTLLPPVTAAAVTLLFYEYVEADGQLIRISPRVFRNQKPNARKLIALGAVLAVLAAVRVGLIADASKDPARPAQPAIVAHRGDSIRAPENTMPAFRLGALLYPDWMEHDVHQTSDGVIIVSHDDDLSRVAGEKLFVHELTYAQTQELDVGAWFSKEYAGTRLSTLDEVLQFFKDYDFGIQIEIKPSGYDTDLEQKVIDIIRENGLEDRCVITCLQLAPLLHIEEIAPEITTVYSMFTAWGNIADIPVDGFTVEESNISCELVSHVHRAGKFIFAWTANTEDTIQYLSDCGVDGILTDDPAMLRNALNILRESSPFMSHLRVFVGQLVRGL